VERGGGDGDLQAGPGLGVGSCVDPKPGLALPVSEAGAKGAPARRKHCRRRRRLLTGVVQQQRCLCPGNEPSPTRERRGHAGQQPPEGLTGSGELNRLYIGHVVQHSVLPRGVFESLCALVERTKGEEPPPTLHHLHPFRVPDVCLEPPVTGRGCHGMGGGSAGRPKHTWHRCGTKPSRSAFLPASCGACIVLAQHQPPRWLQPLAFFGPHHAASLFVVPAVASVLPPPASGLRGRSGASLAYHTRCGSSLASACAAGTWRVPSASRHRS